MYIPIYKEVDDRLQIIYAFSMQSRVQTGLWDCAVDSRLQTPN